MREVSGRIVRWMVDLAKARGISVDRLLEGLDPPTLWGRAGRAVLNALGAQHAQLTERHAQLEKSHRALCAQAERQSAVELLARELSAHTELGPLAHAILDAVAARAPTTAVRLVLEEPGEAFGAPLPAPTHRLELRGARGRVGQLELGEGLSPDALEHVRGLVPWLGLALENACGLQRLRRAQQTLEQHLEERTIELGAAHRARADFLATASQRLRTPLTTLLLPLEALQTWPDLDARLRRDIEGAVRSGYRLLRLVNGLFERPEGPSGSAGERGLLVAEKAGAELTPLPASPEADSRPLLLLVEDNDELRRALTRLLRDEYQIVAAADGEEALALAREQAPDLVLSDLVMPRKDGLELCAALRRDPGTAAIPFILLTALTDVADRVRGLDQGADDYLAKPFHRDELRSRLRAQLRLRQLTAAVAQKEKLSALGVMVAGVAHELRNPVNVMINAIEPVLAQAKLSSEQAELLKLAVEGSRQVERISRQLLAQARPEDRTFAPVNLVESVSLALQLLGHRLANGPSVVPRLPDEPVLVDGEAGALGQVWTNLLDNAIRAAGEPGRVGVSVSTQNGQATVEVWDDGPGIEPRHLRRVFEPFFSTRPVGQGTGLGLAVAQGIIERHQGQLTVESRPGAGARFRAVLPLR